MITNILPAKNNDGIMHNMVSTEKKIPRRKNPQLRVDCHTHILPAFDDGARDLSMSLKMLRRTADVGVETILLTPHYYPSCEDVAAFLERRKRAFQLLEDATERKKTPRLICGAEVYLEQGISKDPDFQKLCIPDTDCVLLEMPYRTLEDWMVEEAESICYTQNCRLILAHLTRYMPYYDEAAFEALISLPNTIIQINVGDLLHASSRKKVLEWMERDFPLLFGSDCHNLDTRPPNLDAAAKQLTKLHHGVSLADIANETTLELGWI